MSRVTDFPDDEEEQRREEPARGEEGGKASFKLPKLSLTERIREFYHAVKLEMAKTTWPTRTEVWSTTVVVLIAIVFFGFYLWGIDMVVTVGFQALEKAIR
ncbi:MAG TPA: preprotein translocase subunit SecE [Blastocatellia bacterium]|jgi:preprotein translocase subunit SecE|nr:preprotein translocase subunit SecE [Blastocatellia bacterium]